LRNWAEVSHRGAQNYGRFAKICLRPLINICIFK
jgi:hypothetical protein